MAQICIEYINMDHPEYAVYSTRIELKFFFLTSATITNSCKVMYLKGQR